MKKKTHKQLLKDAWIAFSGYVKRIATDWRGYCRCFTCGKVMNAETNSNEIHAGHFKHGRMKEFYYDPRNCKVQCRQCNFFGGDNVIKAYTIRLIKEIGIEEVEKLQNAKDKYYSNEELNQIIQKYETQETPRL